METWEIYYWIVASLVCFEALVAIIYFVVFAITGKEVSEGSKIIAGAVWCVTLVLFIVAIVFSALNG